jgi:hypothetical protein
MDDDSPVFMKVNLNRPKKPVAHVSAPFSILKVNGGGASEGSERKEVEETIGSDGRETSIKIRGDTENVGDSTQENPRLRY